MCKAEIAEFILSLAATSDRASAMAGDFVEDDSIGAWQFWFLVIRTAVAQTWRQMASAPRAVAGIAMRGALAEVGYLVAACFIELLFLAVAVSVLLVSFHAELSDGAVAWLAWILSNVAVPVQVGRWMARRYPGREGSGALALGAFHAATNLLVGWIFLEIAVHGTEAHASISFSQIRFIDWNADPRHAISAGAFYVTLYPLLLLAGAAWQRATSFASRVRP